MKAFKFHCITSFIPYFQNGLKRAGVPCGGVGWEPGGGGLAAIIIADSPVGKRLWIDDYEVSMNNYFEALTY
jgi:hypothetical protein